jgi:hypothetical protein
MEVKKQVRLLMRVAFAVTFATFSGCMAEQWELGGAAGYGLYRNQTVSRGTEQAKAGFRHGLALSAVAGHHSHRYLSGEVRYMFRDSDLKISSGSTDSRFSGEAHVVTYDVLLHSAPNGSRVRPFLAFGGGVKVFRGTGQETEFQPLDRLAVLTRTSELKPLFSLGGGVRFQISRHAFLRFDVRDYMTPFPKEVIAPVPGARLNGWVHDLVPMVGISAFF